MTKPKNEPMLADFINLPAMAAAASADQRTLVRVTGDVPRRLRPDEVAAARVRHDLQDRLGLRNGGEAA